MRGLPSPRCSMALDGLEEHENQDQGECCHLAIVTESDQRVVRTCPQLRRGPPLMHGLLKTAGEDLPAGEEDERYQKKGNEDQNVGKQTPAARGALRETRSRAAGWCAATRTAEGGRVVNWLPDGASTPSTPTLGIATLLRYRENSIPTRQRPS